MKIENSRLLLRPLRLTDLPDVYLNIRHRDVSRLTGAGAGLSTETPAVWVRFGRYFLKGLQMLAYAFLPGKEQQIHRIAIVLKERGRVIGIATLARLQQDPHCAEMGLWIGKKYWGGGIGSEALRLQAQYGFECLGLNRYVGCTYEENIGIRRAMDKVGFRFEGYADDEGTQSEEQLKRMNYSLSKPDFYAAIAGRQVG